jgi:hypothetical protein
MVRRGVLSGSVLAILLSRLFTQTASAAAVEPKTRDQAGAQPQMHLVGRTLVVGDADIATLRLALDALPRQPERLVVLDVKAASGPRKERSASLDAFVPVGSRTIYVLRQSVTLREAELSGGAYVLILAVAIWHEMAHTEGLDETAARRREEELWQRFVLSGRVESSFGVTYLDDLRRRK